MKSYKALLSAFKKCCCIVLFVLGLFIFIVSENYHVIYQTRGREFHQISTNTKRWVEKTRRSRVFFTDFEVYGYLMKHSFECLIWLLKVLIMLREIQSKTSPNFMIIRITHPNLRVNGNDFLCFLFINY